MAKASDNNFPSVLFLEGTVPANPAASHQRLYIDTADNKLKRVNSAGTVVVIDSASGLADGTWTDYSATSTIVGWVSFTTKHIWYKQVGKTVFVTYALNGTSNSATTTFTLPAAAVAAPSQYTWVGATFDNSTYTAGFGILLASASTVTLYKTLAYAAWANSAEKDAQGQFWYVTA